MTISLKEVLDLVGKLDDVPGEDVARERFRRYLAQNLREAGQIRDYVEECLRNTGEQYNRALQDLVNHIGQFLGFTVTFGRYQGVRGQVGFDGYWQSATGFHIVVEVKTTEVYSVKTATLMDYVNLLISDRAIPDWQSALGLYVIGRPDPEVKQLEHAIIAERRSEQLRIISVDSLLSLAEMMGEFDVRHQDILAVLRPSGPAIDQLVDLMTRLVAPPKADEPKPASIVMETPYVAPIPEGESAYWLTPVATDEEQTAEEVIEYLVGRERIYAFGERTPGRSRLKPGDWMCFYASGKGIVAHAQVASPPAREPDSRIRRPEQYPWTFKLSEVRLYIEDPLVIDLETRKRMDAFRGRDPSKSWSWLVQGTRKLSRNDFALLTRG